MRNLDKSITRIRHELLNEREMKILIEAGFEKVKDFEDVPVVALVQLNKLGYESMVDVLRTLYSHFQSIKYSEIDEWDNLEIMLRIDNSLFAAGYKSVESIAQLTVGQALSIKGITYNMIRPFANHIMKTYYEVYSFHNVSFHSIDDVKTNSKLLFSSKR